MARELNTINIERQDILELALKEAKEIVVNQKLDKNKALLLESKNWAGGIVGLIASRLVSEFNRPAFVLSLGETELKGSARSIEGFHLVEALATCSDLLTRHGGHSKAAGLSLLNINLDFFKNKMIALADSKLSDADIIPKLNIDAEVTEKELNYNFYTKWLKNLEPFGLGNPRPVFVISGAEIFETKWCGKDKNHLRVGFLSNTKKYWGIGFSWLKDNELNNGEKVDIVCTLDEDNWNGAKSLGIKLLEIVREGEVSHV